MTSVSWALFIATSVPVPIAMPTSARASAGASLMPSPAIATTRPSACSFSTSAELVGRLDLAVHLVDAQALADRARRGQPVAGGHDHAQAGGVQRLSAPRAWSP